MDASPVALKKLAQCVLRDGALPLAVLLENVAPVAAMRALAQKHGLTPKGGFRLEKAPAAALAPLLAEQKQPDVLEEVLRLLLPGAAARPAKAAAPAREPDAEVRQLLALRDAEVARLRDELERAREGAQRGREREVALEQRLQAVEEQLVLVRRAAVERAAADVGPAVTEGRDDRGLQHKVRELELECEGFLGANEALRRQQAVDRSRLRELEDEVAELEALVPKNHRRKRRPMPPEPEPERRFVLPRFLPSFYKSLEGKDRRAAARAIEAVLLFCTEGHGYPGLEVKQMGGQDTWSLRASLGLRVYFRQLGAGEIEVLELADREDQHTTLRRLKER